uniref:Uncharacterized protein n=1 Tax=Cacopsylla melanoneura TaxID=428564 RepID=A0A8D8SBA4_9HEMI
MKKSSFYLELGQYLCTYSSRFIFSDLSLEVFISLVSSAYILVFRIAIISSSIIYVKLAFHFLLDCFPYFSSYLRHIYLIPIFHYVSWFSPFNLHSDFLSVTPYCKSSHNINITPAQSRL